MSEGPDADPAVDPRDGPATVEARARLRAARGGLCAGCRRARGVASSRGSSFLLCTHPELPKYPPQPVVRCGGYAAADG